MFSKSKKGILVVQLDVDYIESINKENKLFATLDF